MPIALILTFLRANWLPILIGLAATALLGYVTIQNARITHLKHVYVACQTGRKADAQTYETALKSLKGALNAQNAALQAAATENYRTQKAATLAIGRAQRGRIALEKRLQAIDKATAPGDCPALHSLRSVYEATP